MLRRVMRNPFTRRFIALLAPVLLACSSDPQRVVDEPPEPVALDPNAQPVKRDKVRAFYSGHSLTDNVPEAVAEIARSLQLDFDFNFQSGHGALMRDRTQGPDPSAKDWSGYRFGRNRDGEGLDVAAEFQSPRTLAPGERYTTLVTTERHDLAYAAAHENTPYYLQHLVKTFAQSNPDGDVHLYQSWLEWKYAPPAQWISYERDALRLWECVASAANRGLAADGVKTRVRVIPGAGALADLMEEMVAGRAPFGGKPLDQQLAQLFADRAHLGPTGHYFMGAVHFAALFGRSPEGAAIPAGISPELGVYLQRLAWKHVTSYAQRAAAGAQRSMSACRAFAIETMCPRFYALRGLAPFDWKDRLRHTRNGWKCGDRYEESDPSNPFR